MADRTCSIDDCESPAHLRGWCKKHYARYLRLGSADAPVRSYITAGQKADPLDRITSKIEVTDGGCWEWIGARDPRGYGCMTLDKVQTRSHRAVYEMLVGPIPAGLHIDHLCRNPPCCNPDHLEPVTPRENTRRGDGGASRTHCPQGHPYDAENTRLWTGSDGRERRYCRTCGIVRARAWRQSKRQAA